MLARDRDQHGNGTQPIPEQKVTSLVRTLTQRVEKFERRYELTTGLMRSRVQSGQMQETADVSKWLQDAKVLDWVQSSQVSDTAGTR